MVGHPSSRTPTFGNYIDLLMCRKVPKICPSIDRLLRLAIVVCKFVRIKVVNFIIPRTFEFEFMHLDESMSYARLVHTFFCSLMFVWLFSLSRSFGAGILTTKHALSLSAIIREISPSGFSLFYWSFPFYILTWVSFALHFLCKDFLFLISFPFLNCPQRFFFSIYLSLFPSHQMKSSALRCLLFAYITIEGFIHLSLFLLFSRGRLWICTLGWGIRWVLGFVGFWFGVMFFRFVCVVFEAGRI